jgi:hypothetical protein
MNDVTGSTERSDDGERRALFAIGDENLAALQFLGHQP